MNKIDVLLGLQWGDEGKGKIVDFIAKNYNVVARYQGGPNAGHSIHIGDTKIVLHTIPSGIFNPNSINFVGNGVVICPVTLQKECEELVKLGIDAPSRLLISKKAHIILPTHKLLDKAIEQSKGEASIGSTLKGISPTYTDKISRNGIRIGDILENNFAEKYNKIKQIHEKLLREFYKFDYDLTNLENEFLKSIDFISKLQLVDGEYFVNEMLNKGQNILAEGAQGAMLDIDFGTYPFVTSSNTTALGVCAGIGAAPNKIGDVYGICKAYTTRVGNGAFPTELFDDNGKNLQNIGKEFGATTGRQRRCGWLDIPQLKYATMLNGLSHLIITKIDVLNSFEKINVCTKYQLNGQEIEHLPYNLADIKPIYKQFDGWQKDLKDAKKKSDLPKELLFYLDFIEESLNIPVKILSIGADRDDTIIF